MRSFTSRTARYKSRAKVNPKLISWNLKNGESISKEVQYNAHTTILSPTGSCLRQYNAGCILLQFTTMTAIRKRFNLCFGYLNIMYPLFLAMKITRQGYSEIKKFITKKLFFPRTFVSTPLTALKYAVTKITSLRFDVSFTFFTNNRLITVYRCYNGTLSSLFVTVVKYVS